MLVGRSACVRGSINTCRNDFVCLFGGRGQELEEVVPRIPWGLLTLEKSKWALNMGVHARVHAHAHTCAHMLILRLTHTPIYTLNCIHTCVHAYSHTTQNHTYHNNNYATESSFLSYKRYSNSFYLIFLEGHFQRLDDILWIYSKGADFILFYLTYFRNHSSRHPIARTCTHTYTVTHASVPPSFINTLGVIYCCYSWEQLSQPMLLSAPSGGHRESMLWSIGWLQLLRTLNILSSETFLQTLNQFSTSTEADERTGQRPKGTKASQTVWSRKE